MKRLMMLILLFGALAFCSQRALLGGEGMSQEEGDNPAASQEKAVPPAGDASQKDAPPVAKASPDEGAQPTADAPQDDAAEPAVSENEAAIRKAIDSFVQAFNQGDAKALAAHWTERGESITPGGETLRGRQALEADFTAFFKEAKGAKIELFDTTVELFSPSVAVETGMARVLVAEQEPVETEYEAIHVKTADGWKLDRVSEQEPPAPPPSNYEKLAELEWMIGHWVNADEGSSIDTTCRWTTNHNFIVRTFKVFIQDRVDFEGTQVIGWDPSAQAIRSWLFDSDGGFGVGRWSGGGSHWQVQTLNVLPDGRRASATNIYELVDENTVEFRSIGRQLDGVLMPNIDPVTAVRATDES